MAGIKRRKYDVVLMLLAATAWKKRLYTYDRNGFKELGQVVLKTMLQTQKNLTQLNLNSGFRMIFLILL